MGGLCDDPRCGARARSKMRKWKPFSCAPWKVCRTARRTGVRAAWRARLGCRPRPYSASGVPSACSLTAPRPSSSRPTRTSSAKYETSSVSTCPPPARWCCASTRKARSSPGRSQPLLPMRPGQIERRTHDYQRHGTTSLFADSRHRHRGRHRPMLSQASRQRVPALPGRDREGGAGRSRCASGDGQLRYAQDLDDPQLARQTTALARSSDPTGASWINQVERFFALLSQRQIKRGAHRSVAGAPGGDHHLPRHTQRDPNPSAGPNPPTKSSRRSSASA